MEAHYWASLFILLVCLLTEGRNYLFQQATLEEPFPQLLELTARERALIYLGLVSGTLLLMFSLAGFSLVGWATIIAFGAIVVLNFLLISTLQTVLGLMRQRKHLSILLLFNPWVVLMAGLMIAVELSFLNWVKEVVTYFQPPFGSFILSYSLLIFIVAGYLNLRIHDQQFLRNKAFILLTLLDSILVVSLVGIFRHFTLAIIYSFN